MTVTPYQPRWVKGQARMQGQRNAEVRYDAIRTEIEKAELGDFTVLDFGAYGGYFSFRLAEDFHAEVVAVDDHPELRRGIEANHNPLVTPVYDRLSSDGVGDLGEFDVVLALSVLHHVPDWERMLEALCEAATELLFIETPRPDEELPNAANRERLGGIWTHVHNLGGEVIATVAGYDKKFQRELKVVRV